MLAIIAHFFAGMFIVNSLPHLLNGISGRAFPTPFASPPGKGESTAPLNVLWGALNLVVGCGLLSRGGPLFLLDAATTVATGSGALITGLLLAWHFGSLYGGVGRNQRR